MHQKLRAGREPRLHSIFQIQLLRPRKKIKPEMMDNH